MPDPKLGWIPGLTELQLDIVGIVAILGEGCITRTAQASSLSWLHVIPRLLPAPQALLRHEQEAKLPARPGCIVGIYSGNMRAELNFFTYLMHREPLERNQVQLLKVTRKHTHPHDKLKCSSCKNHRHCRYKQAFRIKTFGAIGILSLVGFCMAVGLIVGSVILRDGFALLATLLLSMTSSIVGYASWWNLEFEEEQPRTDRRDDIPQGDVVIYYPTGAFRVVRCEEEISRLYFKSEICKPVIHDNLYRLLALVASAFLMAGLLCMSNAHIKMQISLAACYISLNMVHWAVSAMKPYKHWEHDYDVKELKFNPPIQKLPSATPIAANDTPSQSAVTPPADSTAANDQQSNDEHRSAGSNVVRIQSPSDTDNSPSGQPHTDSDSQQTGSTQVNPTEADQLVDRLRRRVHTDLEASRQRPIRRTPTTSRGTFHRLLRRITTTTEDPSAPGFKEDRRFTAALWQVIALTGNGKWLHRMSIAPATPAWQKWIDEAHSKAEGRLLLRDRLVPAWREDPVTRVISLPDWDYQGALNRLLKEQQIAEKRRPRLYDVVIKTQSTAWGHILPESIIARLRTVARNARESARARRSDMPSSPNRAGRVGTGGLARTATMNPIRPIVRGMRQLTLPSMFSRNSGAANGSNDGTVGAPSIPLDPLRGTRDRTRAGKEVSGGVATVTDI